MPIEAEIAGVGMHPFGRYPDRSLKDLASVAVLRAVADAGIGVLDVDAVYSSNALAGVLLGQEQVRGQTVASYVGIEGVPITNVENACASGSTALREAIQAVSGGFARVALVVGFEKMFVDDREVTLNALRSAADLDVVDGLGLQFTGVYAMRLQRRLRDGSLTLDDLAASAVKSHAHGALNPYAQYRKPVTAEEVLGSRRIADPLTLLMCSSFADGAAAAIVTAPDSVQTNGRRRVRIRASSMRTARTSDTDADPTVAEVAARDAYETAGVGPGDLDVLEVHDAMAPGELLYYEQLGLCAEGDAAKLLHSGETSLGGKRVVNPSGGLSSRGHPVGATGLGQIAELTWQLRGEAGDRQVEGARLALAQNSGGWLHGESAVCNVHVLEGCA